VVLTFLLAPRVQNWCCSQVHTARVSQAQLGDCYHRCTVVATRAASFASWAGSGVVDSSPSVGQVALAAMAMREQMRVAMAHLAHTASQLSGDMNAGYIDYDEVDDRRGCRPVDSSDSEQEENFDCGDVSVSALVFTCLSLLCPRTISFFCTIVTHPCLAT
jgi:hypothetical protein